MRELNKLFAHESVGNAANEMQDILQGKAKDDYLKDTKVAVRKKNDLAFEDAF